jgi:multiple sugar transport system substrate-binding protein
MLMPLSARAADLVIWWEKGFNPEEDQAVQELVAAFEQKTGNKVQLAFFAIGEIPSKTAAAAEAGHPPDLVYGIDITGISYTRWAHEGRLADLADAFGPLAAQLDKEALDYATMLNGTTGRHGLYALPMGLITTHLHIWKSLLGQVGFTLADVPTEWEPFWSFWCDEVQPAVRKATGRNDVYAVGLPMSVLPSGDTYVNISQFVTAYGADYVTPDGRLVIDEPEVRAKLVKALESYTALYRKGCVPPDAAGWDNYGNNKAFREQRVVLTMNSTLSLPGEFRATRPEDYYKNTATIGWPSGVHGQPLAIYTAVSEATVFKAGGHEQAAKEFVRFLVAEGWLAHWLDFGGDRLQPPIPALLEQPFWLDPSDPHRMAAAIQALTKPMGNVAYVAEAANWRLVKVWQDKVWQKAVHRVVTEGVTPEQAVDEAIARIKQILSE